MSKCVLLVDDFSSIRRMMGLALKKAGYSIIEAANGREALLRLEEVSVDMIVTDLNMPVLDGMGLAKEVRAGNDSRDIPIIMVSSDVGKLKRDEAKCVGITCWLTKPFKIDTLLNTVREVLE